MNKKAHADLDAERALIGACILSDEAAESAISMLDPADFLLLNHQEIFAAITAQVKLGDGRVDIVRLASVLSFDEAGRYLHELQNETPTISNATHYAETIAGWSLRRKIVFAADAIQREAMEAVTPAGDVAEHARERFAALDMPARIGAPDPDVDSFIGSVDMRYDWLIPDFLERRDRMLVTAGEGAGKSVLLRQIAVQTAAGVHPWTGVAFPPANVLIVDLENSTRQVSRALEHLRKQAGADLDPARLRVCSRSDGIDLSTRTDRRWLLERCIANKTDLLVIGPLYRMESGVADRGDTGGQDKARQVTAALDEIRMRCNVTLLMETHAPHSNGGFGRDLRPFGSSVWMRWPEFGIGLRRHDPDNRDVYDVEHWRGPRDERVWPTQLKRGAGRWMWTPTMPTGTFKR